LRFLHKEGFSDLIIGIHQRTQIVANLEKHIVRIGPADFLNALDFLVVLLFLCVGGVWYLLELRLQIIQYILNLASGTFNVLVKLTPLLDCCNRSICSRQ